MPIEKELTRIDKNGKEITKNISYMLQLIDQTLSIVFLKEFIKLNVNSDTTIKNVILVELHMKYATVFLNTQTLKMI